MLLSSCLLFYMCCFLIRLFAVWRYAGRIFNAGICRGKAISEFRSPNALPRAPTPLGTEGVLRCCVCCVVDFCLYAAVLRMERCAGLVSVFFDTYRNILYQSDISGQDAQSASIPRMFFPVGWKRQPEEGGIGPGCCGGGVITTWAARDGVIAAGSAV